MKNIRLPAEWEPHRAIMLTWPHAHSDWASELIEIVTLYKKLCVILLKHVDVILAVHPEEVQSVQVWLSTLRPGKFRAHLYSVPSNDVWTRDHGPIGVLENDGLRLLDFQFNGWGNKFATALDNKLNQSLFQLGAFAQARLQKVDYVLEGGAIDTDGKGLLLTTSACLLNPNRNPKLSKDDITSLLKRTLGIKKILWLEHGHLEGDDTDSHIDTLARLAPNNTILYMQCQNPGDLHFLSLSAMEAQLKTFTDSEGKGFTLVPLPLPKACFDNSVKRLPATYANFLVTNKLVLVPTYNVPEDTLALDQIQSVFKDRAVKGIDCSALIQQHGSLHCITMQISALE